MLLKPDFPTLAAFAALLGAGMLVLALPGVVAPARTNRLWRAFPRDVWTGRILAVLALLWATLWGPAILMEFAPAFAMRNPGVYQCFFPIAVVAVCTVLKDLLACRAAGILFALIPAPLLAAARWHPSPARYLVIVIAYILAVAGMFFIAKPWLLRDVILAANATEKRTRLVSALFLVCALAILLCAAVFYPVSPETLPLGQN